MQEFLAALRLLAPLIEALAKYLAGGGEPPVELPERLRCEAARERARLLRRNGKAD